MSRMNPIRETEIGTRKMEPLTLYPLSLADQAKMTELITSALQAFFDPKKKAQLAKGEESLPEQMSDIETVAFVVDLIKQNLKKMLSMVTDYNSEAKAGKLLEKITNTQATEIATIIFEQNYETAIKNGVSLFKRIVQIIPQQMTNDSLKRQSPQSSKDTHNIDSSISSGSASAKAD